MQLVAMQGRLEKEPIGGGANYCHPNWANELPKLRRLGIGFLEWIVDGKCFLNNPLLLKSSRRHVIDTCADYGIVPISAVLNNYVINPINTSPSPRFAKELTIELVSLLTSLSAAGIKVATLPIMNNKGSSDVDSNFLEVFRILDAMLGNLDIKIALEIDSPLEFVVKLVRELKHFENVGFTFDMGNSKAQGNDVVQEIESYGHKLFNVHIKDRKISGERVPLGRGDVDFQLVNDMLLKLGYQGRMVLEGAWYGESPEIAMEEYVEFCGQFNWRL